MISISPFKALIPTPEQVTRVAAVPYDVVDRREAAVLANGNPFSFLRVSRPEIELSEDIDPYDDRVYEKAAENFRHLRKSVPMKVDEQESLYIYSLVLKGRRQTGIVAAASVDDYDNNLIKKHELTRQTKEDDRTRHALAIQAHTGPIFLTYKSVPKIKMIVDGIMDGTMLFDMDFDDGVRHQIWRVPGDDAIKLAQLFNEIPSLYVADGHHRAKSASRARETCRSKNSTHTGAEAYNRFLGVIFPSDELAILPYNRVVFDLNGLTESQFRERLTKEFNLAATSRSAPESKGQIHVYLSGQWYCLTIKEAGAAATIIDRLDVSILQNRILKPILGIDDPRTDSRIDFIGGIHGAGKLMELVDSGSAATAFSMYPVTVEDLMAVSDADLIMPPKSTWFEPKLRDGILCYCF